MLIKKEEIYIEAKRILQKSLSNSNAEFREGQYEAIEAVFTNRRSLVVQKTGWGKSFVYFISTKINRNKGKGLSLVISPLLVLIENQIEAANKVGLICNSISSTNKEKHSEIIEQLKMDKIDILFTTPESLFSILQPHLKDIYLGMFIIDEAHCISDWGHDFRLEYRKIVDVLNQLKDKEFPILATTATANNRVIEDLKNQIGPNLYISRGPLYRDNLQIQLLDLENKVNRYAWILEHINDFIGTGIIYCLTTKDCDNLTKFLKLHEVMAESYHSGLEVEESSKNIALFVSNKIKVLVSTIKLGMGYDKPDVSFILHYQVPKNIVSYYQQIGRAARNITTGYAIMLKGGNDFEILDNFIKNSFPTQNEMDLVLKQFSNSSWDESQNGLSPTKVSSMINLSLKSINKAFMFLEFEGVINRLDNKYFLTGNSFFYNQKHYLEITRTREQEIDELKSLFITNDCLSKVIINALDDNSVEKCGKCINCIGKNIVSEKISKDSLNKAQSFIDSLYITINPKRTYKIEGTGINYYNENKIRLYNELYNYPIKTDSAGRNYVRIPDNFYCNEIGIALSKYGDEGIGKTVAECKHKNIDYPNELLQHAVKILKPYIEKNKIDSIAFVPSKNNILVDNFAKKLADYFNLKLLNVFRKVSNSSQKSMSNMYFQRTNVENSYVFTYSYALNRMRVLLLDDMVDSGWTFNYLGKELLRNKVKLVFPVALTDTSVREVDND